MVEYIKKFDRQEIRGVYRKPIGAIKSLNRKNRNYVICINMKPTEFGTSDGLSLRSVIIPILCTMFMDGIINEIIHPSKRNYM